MSSDRDSDAVDTESTLEDWFSERIDTPRCEWPSDFRVVVEAFEKREELSSFKPAGRYPKNYEPFVLHGEVEAPIRPGADSEYSWYVMLNPWSGRDRTAWITDGRPLLNEETVHGAEDPETDLIARDQDLIDVFPFRVVVCIALTQVASFHSRGGDWLVDDEEIEQQFRETVIPELRDSDPSDSII